METLNQLPDPSCSENEKQNALMSLLHTSNLIRKQREKILERLEISQQKLNILEVLFREFPATLSQCQIRERISDKTIDLSRIIDQMDRNCLLTQTKCKHRKTISEIALTRKGTETLFEISKYKDEMSRATAYLSDEDIKQLIATMQKITDALVEQSIVGDTACVSADISSEGGNYLLYDSAGMKLDATHLIRCIAVLK